MTKYEKLLKIVNKKQKERAWELYPDGMISDGAVAFAPWTVLPIIEMALTCGVVRRKAYAEPSSAPSFMTLSYRSGIEPRDLTRIAELTFTEGSNVTVDIFCTADGEAITIDKAHLTKFDFIGGAHSFMASGDATDAVFVLENGETVGLIMPLQFKPDQMRMIKALVAEFSAVITESETA